MIILVKLKYWTLGFYYYYYFWVNLLCLMFKKYDLKCLFLCLKIMLVILYLIYLIQNYFVIQGDVKKELELLLSRQCQLDAKMRGITKVLPTLQIVHSDALQLTEMISFTSTLAENVSAKVRQLDIARVNIFVY